MDSIPAFVPRRRRRDLRTFSSSSPSKGYKMDEGLWEVDEGLCLAQEDVWNGNSLTLVGKLSERISLQAGEPCFKFLSHCFQDGLLVKLDDVEQEVAKNADEQVNE